MYVGRVGGLALALGLGLAVASGAGVANAAGDTDGGPGPKANEGAPGGQGDAASSGVKLHKPGPLKLSKIASGDSGGAPTNPLSGLVARIPHKIAAALDDSASGTSSPTDLRTAPRGSALRSTQPSGGLSQAGPTTAGNGTVAPLVHTLTEHLGDLPSSTADPIVQEAFTVSPSATTTPESVTGLAKLSPAAPAPVTTFVSGIVSALGGASSNTGGTPTSPGPVVLGALQLIRRETVQPNVAQTSSLASIGSLFHPTPLPSPTTLPDYPTGPADTVPIGTVPAPDQTALVAGVGNVGKWMLQSDGTVSNYGGQTYGGKTMVEPVNVIIIDPTSTSAAESQAKVNKDLALGGFPIQPVHSGGFQGTINGVTYQQKPALPLTAYSDNSFLVQNDHGRLFGPAPATSGTGYVYTGAFSTETPGISENGIPGHTYVSSNEARDELALRLLASGQVSSITYVKLDNAIDPNDPNYTTGDADGYAVVITLK
jgi:hypothetical protein